VGHVMREERETGGGGGGWRGQCGQIRKHVRVQTVWDSE
jgi:hypothetical protein